MAGKRIKEEEELKITLQLVLYRSIEVPSRNRQILYSLNRRDDLGTGPTGYVML